MRRSSPSSRDEKSLNFRLQKGNRRVSIPSGSERAFCCFPILRPFRLFCPSVCGSRLREYPFPGILPGFLFPFFFSLVLSACFSLPFPLRPVFILIFLPVPHPALSLPFSLPAIFFLAKQNSRLSFRKVCCLFLIISAHLADVRGDVLHGLGRRVARIAKELLVEPGHVLCEGHRDDAGLIADVAHRPEVLIREARRLADVEPERLDAQGEELAHVHGGLHIAHQRAPPAGAPCA